MSGNTSKVRKKSRSPASGSEKMRLSAGISRFRSSPAYFLRGLSFRPVVRLFVCSPVCPPCSFARARPFACPFVFRPPCLSLATSACRLPAMFFRLPVCLSFAMSVACHIRPSPTRPSPTCPSPTCPFVFRPFARPARSREAPARSCPPPCCEFAANFSISSFIVIFVLPKKTCV